MFQKTEVPCLYRYSSNGVYYALAKEEGKQKRASSETTDKATAKRRLGDFQRDLGKVDPSQGRVTLRESCARSLLTVQNPAPATVCRKKHIVGRLLHDFSGGADPQISKIRQSSQGAWLATYKFGHASQTRVGMLQCCPALYDESWLIVDTESDVLMTPIHGVGIAAQKMRGWQRDGERFRVLLNHDVSIDPAEQGEQLPMTRPRRGIRSHCASLSLTE